MDPGSAAHHPVKAVKLLGENLVLFRDEQGRYGLIERRWTGRCARSKSSSVRASAIHVQVEERPCARRRHDPVS
jgi:hypothetical protein